MTDEMTDEELIAEVKRHWEHWAGHLGLDMWWCHIGMMDEDEVKANPGNSLVISHHTNEYLRAYLRINPDQTRRVFSLSLSVLHEACHIKYSNIEDYAAGVSSPRNAWDQVLETECDHTAMIIWRLHEQTGCKG